MDKARYKELEQGCRSLWNEFDPIGVFSFEGEDWPEDEYDFYLQPTLALLAAKDRARLKDYIHATITRTIGVGVSEAKLEAFVGKLETWYRQL